MPVTNRRPGHYDRSLVSQIETLAGRQERRFSEEGNPRASQSLRQIWKSTYLRASVHAPFLRSFQVFNCIHQLTLHCDGQTLSLDCCSDFLGRTAKWPARCDRLLDLAWPPLEVRGRLGQSLTAAAHTRMRLIVIHLAARAATDPEWIDVIRNPHARIGRISQLGPEPSHCLRMGTAPP